MVSSASVPTQYTLTWDARTSSDTSGSSPAVSPHHRDFGLPSQRRLREACDGCRHSRVRCGGGHPCSRCRTRSMDCHYGFSRRSGRLRASPLREMQPPAPITTPSSTSSSMAAHIREETNTNYNSNTNNNNHINNTRVNNHSTMLDPAAILNPGSQPPVGDLSDNSWLNFSTFMGASSAIDDMNLYPNFTFDVPPTQAFDPPNGHLNHNHNHNQNAFSPPHTPPFTNPPPTTCTCLASQLSCITAMVNYRDLNNVGIDTILNNARETIKALNGQLKCADCTKGTWSFLLTIIILQRLLYMFCSLASCRFVDVKSAKIGIGNYELSDEEDLAHKRMLALSSLKGFEDFVSHFWDAVKKFIRLTETMKSQCKTPLKTDCTNLKWASEGLEYITARLEQIRVTIESDQWRKGQGQACCN